MNVNAFIFSNNRNYRLSRHAVFWALWIFYYSLMTTMIAGPRIGYAKSFFEALAEVAESTPMDMCFCYFIIYYLFPKFLFNGKYITMLGLWFVASIVFVVLFELNSIFIAPSIRAAFGLPVMPPSKYYAWDFFTLFTQINMEGCLAASIKLGKLWYIKQQEIDLLKQEKEKVQPYENEGLVQPAFLADMLKRMETIANENPLLAAQSIKKIRNLILYILYEDASSQVSLQKELQLLQEYIDLEKLTAEKTITTNVSIKANACNETIAPSIILPIVENAFKQVALYSLKYLWIDVNVELNQGVFKMQLSWGKPIDTSSLLNGSNVILHNLSKRLKLIYPQSHHIKMIIEAEKIIVDLNIDLKRAVN